MVGMRTGALPPGQSGHCDAARHSVDPDGAIKLSVGKSPRSNASTNHAEVNGPAGRPLKSSHHWPGTGGED